MLLGHLQEDAPVDAHHFMGATRLAAIAVSAPPSAINQSKHHVPQDSGGPIGQTDYLKAGTGRIRATHLLSAAADLHTAALPFIAATWRALHWHPS